MVTEIHITPSEQAAQSLSENSFNAALALLDEQGYLVLRNAVPTSHLTALRDLYDQAWAAFKSGKSTWIAGGQIIGQLNVNPPVSEHFANSDVLGNRIVYAITSAVLGKDLCIIDVGGNTNEPGSVDQYLHSDVDFKDFSKLLVNIPLSDADEHNGSIELVPMSHNSDVQFPEPVDVAASQGPIRINSQLGDVLIRYPHVWHRGRANPSRHPRHMLSAWHQAIPKADRPSDKLMIDPSESDLFASYKLKLEELGIAHTGPEFRPNYFSANMNGLIKETIYRYAPKSYMALLRVLKKLK